MSKRKIAVVGLGKAGLPLASVIAESGVNVTGVDIDSVRCASINSGINPIPEEPGLNEIIKRYGGKELFATSNYEDAKNCNVYIVIVPLFLDDNNIPILSTLEKAFRSIATILSKEDIIVLETTVPPMTTETLVRQWLEDECDLKLGDYYLAFSPERIMTGYSISRLKEFPKVIGGVDKESGVKAHNIYKTFIPNLHLVSSAKVAEFIKIIEGCYRDVNIALANELFKIAEQLKIDFSEARGHANHEYCNIHEPSTGVGGHCIPVYPWFLINEMDKRGEYGCAKMLRISRVINDEMIRYWGGKIVMESLKSDEPLSDVKICVKGITYRKGVKELYNSRNLALAKFLVDKGLDTYAYDEVLDQEHVELAGLKWIRPEDADIIFDTFNLTIIAANRGGLTQI